MNFETTLFRKSDPKSTTLTLRLSPAQKQCVYDMANQNGTSISHFLLSLVGQECERLNKAYETTTAKAADNNFRMNSGNHTTPCDPLTDYDLDIKLKSPTNSNMKPTDKHTAISLD